MNELMDAVYLAILLLPALFVSVTVIFIFVVIGRKLRLRPFRSYLENFSNVPPSDILQKTKDDGPSVAMCHETDIETGDGIISTLGEDDTPYYTFVLQYELHTE